ncbi:MAG: EAL domain-containing protein, partial [Nocardioidaceae bacterium]
QDRARRWAAAPDDGSTRALRAGSRSMASVLAADAHRVDVRTAGILTSVLLAVSTGWFVWFRKLVRRHRAETRALTEKLVLDVGERRLLALVQNSADVVAVLDPDSTASFVSPSSTAVLGMAPDRLQGRRLLDLVAPSDVPVLVSLLASAKDGAQPVTLRTSHADGRELVLEGAVNNLMADPAVAGWVLTVRDVTARQELEEQLTHQAFHDALTGLANRQLFGDRLAHALRRRDGAAEPLVVMLLDLDDFKEVNDSLGHGTGDQLLVTVAERIGASIRQGDTAARLGGDEFAVLLEDADLTEAREVADRLLAALGVPVAVGDSLHTVCASIGMCQAVPGESEQEATLRNADVAMYWAKGRGKNTVAVYEAGLHARALDRLELRGELQRAIREDQLTLHYQPTVHLESGVISGFEALVRWRHPVRGLLPPGDFISVAEESGLIVPLGSWVLDRACRDGATLQHGGFSPSVAVNVAAAQLAKPDFAGEVDEVLRRTGMRPDRLVLEITEGTLLDDMEGTIAALTRLRRQGVRIAIDDFGTGYSSLSYLSQLPVDVLKVDKSFIDHVCDSTADASLVRAIVAMGQGMELATVAEGVECVEQAEWLRSAQCSLGQGYLWSRPVELEQARTLLLRGVRPARLPRVS